MPKVLKQNKVGDLIMTHNFFKQNLKKVGFMAWLIRLVPIPVGIVTAKLMSLVVTKATKGNISGVLIDSAILLAIAVSIRSYEIITGIAFEKMSSKEVHQCKIQLYHQFLSFPLHILYASEHGQAIENLNDDFKTVTDRSLSLYPGFWIGVVTAIAYFIFLALQSPLIALIFLTISLLQVIPPAIVKKYMRINYDKTRDIEAQITDFVVQGYKGFATIKLYGLKSWFLERMKDFHEIYSKIGNFSESTLTIENSMFALLDNILKYGTYGIIGFFVLRKYATIGVGVQAIALSSDFFAAVKTIFSAIPDFAVAETAQKRIAKWFGGTNEADEGVRGSDIILSGVSYAYDDKTILENADVAFDGSKICIVKGANGIGKSTLLSLIVGLLRCKDGTIKVGGINPEIISEKEFAQKIFYLPQIDVEFNITAYELYSMIVPDKLRNALRCASDFGLQKQTVNESTISVLSGGERKKVFLSLAFTLDPPILLLDEPTNSLDANGKRILLEKLRMRKSGAIIVTHDSVFDNIAECVYSVRCGGVYCEEIKKNDIS